MAASNPGINNFHNTDNKNLMQDILNALVSAPTGTNATFQDIFNTTDKNLLYAILLAIRANGGGTGTGGGTSGWGLNGNAVSPGNFLGTTNAQPLVFKHHGEEVLRILRNANTSNIMDFFIGEEFMNLYLGGNVGGDGEVNITTPREMCIKALTGLSVVSGTGAEISAEVLNLNGVTVSIDVTEGLEISGLGNAGSGAKLLAVEGASGVPKSVKETGYTVQHLVNLVNNYNTLLQQLININATLTGIGNPWKVGGNSGDGNGTDMLLGTLTTNDLVIVTGSSATEALRATKAARVGVRQDSPSSVFEVNGTIGAAILPVTMAAGDEIAIAPSDAGALTYYIEVVGNGGQVPILRLPDPATDPNRLYILANSAASVDSVAIATSTNGNYIMQDTGAFGADYALQPNGRIWLHSDGANYIKIN